MAHPLEIHDQEEEDGEVGQTLKERRQQGWRHGGDPKKAQRDHRLSHSPLHHHERHETDAACHQADRDRAVERAGGKLDHRPENPEQPSTQESHAPEVQSAGLPLPPFPQHSQRHHQRGQPDRNIDPEDPPPRQVGGDKSTQEYPNDRADVPAHRVEPVGTASPLGGKGIGDHSTAVGGDEGPTQPLEDSEPDHGLLIPGQSAQQRAEDEDGESRLVHPHPAEDVPQPPYLGREQGDDQEVADDDPDHRAEAGV